MRTSHKELKLVNKNSGRNTKLSRKLSSSLSKVMVQFSTQRVFLVTWNEKNAIIYNLSIILFT